MTAHLCMHPRSKNPGYTYDQGYDPTCYDCCQQKQLVGPTVSVQWSPTANVALSSVQDSQQPPWTDYACIKPASLLRLKNSSTVQVCQFLKHTMLHCRCLNALTLLPLSAFVHILPNPILLHADVLYGCPLKYTLVVPMSQQVTNYIHKSSK